MGSSGNVIERKIALMGYPCVGKSSITLRFVKGHFPDAYDTTIEDCHNKRYKFKGREYNLAITDTAGQQEYSLFPRSCSLDHGYILVYAIDDRRSFEIIKTIHDKILENNGEAANVPLVVVGNKVDLQHSSRMISTNEGAQLAQLWKGAFIETSAKDNTEVQNIFDLLLSEIEKSESGTTGAQRKNNCVLS